LKASKIRVKGPEAPEISGLQLTRKTIGGILFVNYPKSQAFKASCRDLKKSWMKGRNNKTRQAQVA